MVIQPLIISVQIFSKIGFPCGTSPRWAGLVTLIFLPKIVRRCRYLRARHFTGRDSKKWKHRNKLRQSLFGTKTNFDRELILPFFSNHLRSIFCSLRRNKTLLSRLQTLKELSSQLNHLPKNRYLLII